jgi:transposase
MPVDHHKLNLHGKSGQLWRASGALQPTAQRDVLRARIVLLAATRLRNQEIQAAASVSRPVVVKWRSRFAAELIGGLDDRAGRGRKRKFDALPHCISATACSTPPESVGTHWTVRTLAKHLGVVQAVLSGEAIQPHRSRYWRDSNDPEFEPKMLAIVGRYSNPHENAVVLSVDEKPGFSLWLERNRGCQSSPVRSNASLTDTNAAEPSPCRPCLDVHSGQVSGECIGRIGRNNSGTFHRSLRRLLRDYPDKDLYVIVDNGSSHHSKKTRAWAVKPNVCIWFLHQPAPAGSTRSKSGSVCLRARSFAVQTSRGTC